MIGGLKGIYKGSKKGIKESTLNDRGLNIMIYKVYSLIKGYWALWVPREPSASYLT